MSHTHRTKPFNNEKLICAVRTKNASIQASLTETTIQNEAYVHVV